MRNISIKEAREMKLVCIADSHIDHNEPLEKYWCENEVKRLRSAGVQAELVLQVNKRLHGDELRFQVWRDRSHYPRMIETRHKRYRV